MARARSGAWFGGAVTFVVLTGTLLACATTARVSDLYMALDSDGFRKRNTFFTDSKELHCIVEMGVGRNGVTVEAIIRQLQVYDFASNSYIDVYRVAGNAEKEFSAREGKQTLDVTLIPPVPDGANQESAPFLPQRAQCEAYIDGVLEKTTVYNINFAPCPTAAIVQGSLCFGFYKENDQCPKFGISSRDGKNCVCSIVKGWQCEK